MENQKNSETYAVFAAVFRYRVLKMSSYEVNYGKWQKKAKNWKNCALWFMSWHIYVTRYGDTDWFLVFLIFLTYDLSSKSLIGPRYFEIKGAPTFLASGTG